MSGGNKTHSRYVRGGRVSLPLKLSPEQKAAIQDHAELLSVSANEWVLRVIERELRRLGLARAA